MVSKIKSLPWSLIMVIILGISCISIFFYADIKLKSRDKENEILKKEILAKDTLINHGNGDYSKLVNNFETQKSLNDSLKKNNKELYDIIKKNGEKTISNTSIVFVPIDKDTESKGTIDKKDSTFSYNAFYPDEKKPFISYKSKINLNTQEVKSSWKFNPIDVNIVVTEKENGMWNSHIDAPDYFKVNKLTVNALPKEEIANVKTKKIDFYGGVGVIKINENIKPTINLGIGNKKWLLTGGYGGKETYNVGLMRKF